MEKTVQNTFLETEKTGKLMRKFALPCIVSLLVGALYNIVDQIFIANADYLGSFGNAANSVVFPMTVIALAIATMMGDGCCAFTSINLGAKKNRESGKRRRKRHISACFVGNCTCGDIPYFRGSDTESVRRDGQRRNV